VELSDDFLRKAAQITGQSIEEIKNGIEATAKRLAISETEAQRQND
jgi:hypothetical protein